jgi:hypothetical protein
MATVKRKYPGQPPDLSGAYQEHVGPYTFALAYRDLGHDRGLTLHIFGPVNEQREEILRFECLDHEPHYHLGWSYRDEHFIRIASADPLEWIFDVLTTSFDEFVIRAGADVVLSEASRREVSEAIRHLRERAPEVEAAGRAQPA